MGFKQGIINMTEIKLSMERMLKVIEKVIRVDMIKV